MSGKAALVPVFETERLILKAVSESDIPAYERHFVDYEVIRHLSGAPWPYPDGGVKDYLDKEVFSRTADTQRWIWGLFLKSKPDELIGTIDLWRAGRPENRGFWLGRKFWGLGLMSEAVVPVTNHAFDVLGFETLIFNNALGNDRSRRIKEKTGARLLRTEPAKFVDPAYKEKEVWELTKQNWNSFKKSGL